MDLWRQCCRKTRVYRVENVTFGMKFALALMFHSDDRNKTLEMVRTCSKISDQREQVVKECTPMDTVKQNKEGKIKTHLENRGDRGYGYKVVS